MQIFTVYSIGCNAELFATTYGEYITDVNPGYFGGVEFTLRAPTEIIQEIAHLTDECIEIITIKN